MTKHSRTIKRLWKANREPGQSLKAFARWLADEPRENSLTASEWLARKAGR